MCFHTPTHLTLQETRFLKTNEPLNEVSLVSRSSINDWQHVCSHPSARGQNPPSAVVSAKNSHHNNRSKNPIKQKGGIICLGKGGLDRRVTPDTKASPKYPPSPPDSGSAKLCWANKFCSPNTSKRCRHMSNGETIPEKQLLSDERASFSGLVWFSWDFLLPKNDYSNHTLG